MATDPREAVLAKLTSIDVTLKAILLVLSEKRNDAPAMPDALLAGPYGDPEVKAKDPRDWSGDSMKGRRFSECPPEYLDLLAKRYDYFASTEEDAKKAGYNRKDGQRARGWAQRLRSGWTPPAGAARVNESDGEPQW